MYSFFFFIINFSVNIPGFHTLDLDQRFRNCSQPFECGNIKNITYPFWGNGRANYCGHPDFQLKCEDGSVEIVIQEQTYDVLDIYKDSYKIKMAAVESWNNNCASQFKNISLPPTLFDYFQPFNQNLTFFSRCPFFPQPHLMAAYAYPCSLYDIDGSSYFWAETMGPVPADFARCNESFVVPVLRTPGFNIMQSTVQEVLRQGFEVGYVSIASFCDSCQGSGGQCGYDWNTSLPTCFCYNSTSQGVCAARPPAVNRSNVRRKIEIGVGSAIWVVFVAFILFFFYKKNKENRGNCILFSRRRRNNQRLVEDFLKNNGSIAPRRYNYSDIKKITNSFKHKIGQGGFGGVYKGKLLDGRLVAVKLLKTTKSEGEDFINEVASISRTSHVNAVSLLGFCFEGSKRALIYEFMSKGSLEKFIYDCNALEAENHLGWEALYKITIGVARGLEYLHRGCNTRILHFDIKPHNILLDQNFTPKISDFGMAKLCPRNESIISMLDARGTAGYIAPEVFSRNFGGVSHKSDVYSYGMMVLEIVGRRKNIDVGVDRASEIYFPHWIYKRLELDEDLGLRGVISEEEREITRKMILVALWCIQTNPMDRPAMGKVVEMLERKQELLSIPPKPYLCSPSREPADSSST